MNWFKTVLVNGMRGLQLAMVLLSLALQPVLANKSGPYDVRIEQVDASEFPLVTLYVLVTNPASDEIIGGLVLDDFTVMEDGKPVEIVNFSAGNPGPISTVLAIDRSGSMEAEGKLAGAKQAARAFVDQMRPQDQVALVVFDSAVTTWQDFTSDQNLLRQRIDVVALGNGTAWYDGVWHTVDLMAGVAGRRNAILLSDGKDLREGGVLQRVLGDNGSQHSFEETIEYARSNGVAIHTVGLGARVNTDLSDVEGFDEERLKRMAENTEGVYHHSPTADQLRQLYLSFAENAQKEYIITVRSARASYDGTRRDLIVMVGGSAGSGGYVEQHLLNVESSPWAALVFIAPLALAFIVPFVWRRTRAGPPVPSWTPQVDPPLQAPTAICAHCGRPMRVGARSCARCGSAVSPTLASSPPVSMSSPTAVCSRCGQLLRPNARFCSKCGERSLQ